MTKRIAIIVFVLALVAGGSLWGIRHFRNSPEARLKRADEFFAAEQFDAARIEYMNVLRNDPDNNHALQQIAYSWHEQGTPLSALRFLRATVERDPRNLDARRRLAETWLSLAQFGEARKEVLAILDVDPGHEEAIVLLAKTSFGEKMQAETSERLQQFDPEQKSATFHLASAIVARNNGGEKGLEDFGISINKALAQDPKSPAVHLTLAGFHAFKKDLPKVRESLETAAELAPPRSPIPLSYAAHLARSGEIIEAKAVLEAIRKKAPDYFPALLQLADLHRTEKNYPEALALLERVLASDPGNPGAYQAKARVFLDQQQPDQAIETLEQLDSRIALPLTKLQLAGLHLAGNDVSKARAKLNEALALNPNYAEAILLLANIELRTGSANQAATRLEQLRKKRPDLGQVELVLANAYQRLGRLEDVATILRGRIKEAPDDPRLHFDLGRILYRLKQPTEARQSLQEAHRLEPDNMLILAERVGLELAEDNAPNAHTLVRAQLAGKETAAALFLEGRIFAAESKWAESRDVLTKALELQPDLLPAYNLLVATYVQEKRPAEAIAELETHIEEHPDSIQHIMLIALLHEQQQAYTKAAAAYDEVLKQHPDFPPALNNLAYIASGKLGQLERAEELARKAQKLAENEPAINDTLGWILFQRGKFAEALPFIENAAEKLGDNHEVQFHLGMTRAKMGQTDAARLALTQAVTTPMAPDWLEAAKRELEALDNPGSVRDGRTIEELEAHLRQQPGDAASRLQLGLLYESGGSPDKAAAAFKATTDTNPKLAAAWMGLARVQGNALDDLDQAIEAGRTARRLDGSDPEIAALVGHLALRRAAKGDVQWAYGMLWEAADRLDAPGVHRDYAWASYLQGKTTEARQTMTDLVTAHPDSPEAGDAQHFLSLTAAPEKGWQSLAAAAEARLKEAPEDVPALMVRARLHPDQAVAIYENLLKRFPDFPRAKIRLAAFYARTTDQIAKAETLAREALASLPDDPDLNRVRGAIAFRKGDPKAAIRLIEKDQASVPLDAESLCYLGMACLNDGRDTQGSQALRDALKAGLDPTLEQEARKMLGLGDGG